MTKVIVSTYGTSAIPEFAGSTWVRLQYVLGLQKLGVQAYWVDHIDAIDPVLRRRTLPYLMNRFRRLACDFGFGDRYCVVYNDGEQYFGLNEDQFRKLAAEAGLLLSVSGHLLPDSPLLHIPRRAYLDVDPGFTQIWFEQLEPFLRRHNFFFTVGQNVGSPRFTIPLHGIEWTVSVPPVVLDQWPAVMEERCESFSTVADWRGSQVAVHEGEKYGSKRQEFLRFLSLPGQSGQDIELALCIGPWDYEDMKVLCENGWSLRDPYQVAGDPWLYREFIQYSRAEFSVAKNGYVKSNSGWISDRTVCYLASGKPALVQSTGFESSLPAGRGLLTFRTLEEAVAGVRAINADYPAHCRAARELAEKYFHSDVVLGRLLERVGL